MLEKRVNTMSGFRICRLVVTGEKKEQKSVEFRHGLNFIKGPSDTGKTYIFQAINYMLGGSKKPKKIDESKGYNCIYLEIEDYDKNMITLQRFLSESKKCYVFYSKFEEIEWDKRIEYGTTANSKKSLSSFLLRLCSYQLPIKIRKNASFGKDSFTYRTLNPFILVNENYIIGERSPIHFGSYSDKTKEIYAFKFIMTGEDDSKYDEIVTQPIWNAKKNANIETFISLMENEENSKTEIEEKISSISELFDKNSITQKLKPIQEQITSVNKEIIELENKKQKCIANEKYNRRIIGRLNLLKEQYKSDIERLQFIDEGAFLMNQLNMNKCPHCGKDIKLDHTECDSLDTEQVNEACTYEIQKIEMNVSELNKSLTTAQKIISEIGEEKANIETFLLEKKDHLSTDLEPKLLAIENEWEKYTHYEKLLTEMEIIDKKINDYKKMIENYEEKKYVKTDIPNSTVVDIIEDIGFAKYLEKILVIVGINDKKNSNVKFFISDNEIDFSINEKSRFNYGKGLRGLIASIFYTALLKYCIENKIPHPGFIVIDSPVNALSETDEKEKMPSSLKNNFLRYLADNFKDNQIIIIENKTVPDDIIKDINLIEFTRETNVGRYGFF